MSEAFDPSAVRYGADDLVTAVIQDPADGRVLMVGHMDAEALRATIASGDVYFHSRSRERLWRKGETSGNVLRLVDLELDCDGDAILVKADPAGPTCHTGTRSCFDRSPGPRARAATAAGFGWLDELWRTIDDRAHDRPPGSYTASLIEAGVNATSRKVAEEATEVVLAAKDDAAAEAGDGGRAGTQAALAGELADLIYHALVLAAERGVAGHEVVTVLRTRHQRRRVESADPSTDT